MTVPYSPGLEGVVAAQTEISEVDGQNGRLIYRDGHLIQEVADRSYEEICHLLWMGRLPSAAELEAFRAHLASRRPLNQAARVALTGLPSDADPMDALRTLLSAQGAGPGCPKPDLDGAIAATAVTPTAIAAFYRQRRGEQPGGPPAHPGPAAHLLLLLEGPGPHPAPEHHPQ